MWQRGQAVSIAERCGQFEPNLLTMHGDTQTHDIRAASTGLTHIWQPFPLFSRTLIAAPASECRAPTVPGMTTVPWLQGTPFRPPPLLHWKGIGAEAKVPQVRRFTDYHISRHVIGTFNTCHSTTTPFDLN